MCFKGYNLILEMLLDKGVDVNLCKEDSIIFLYIVCMYGYVEIVKLFLKNGVNYNLCIN